MLKSLYIKIVLILLIFIVAVMCAVGAILMNGVSTFFIDDFTEQMQECFNDGSLLMLELEQATDTDSPVSSVKQVLSSYSSVLGIDQYRNYYVLDLDGKMLAGSDVALGANLLITPNMLSAISGSADNVAVSGTEYADWALRLPISAHPEDDCIIYIKDSLEEMRQLNTMLFTIILQSMLIGIFIAVLLSFFLAKSISSPLQSLTYGTQLVAEGDFKHEIDVTSADEIGVLADNFNYMRERLRITIEEVNGEREKLDTVLSCMKDAVFAFTAGGEVLHSNTAAAELLADQLPEGGPVTLESCFELFDIPLVLEGNTIRLTSPDAKVESTKDGFIFRDRIAGHHVFDVSFAVIRYVDGKRQASGCVLIIHDVTGRYELDESRREFVATVSHELKTPLAAIKLTTETVRNDPEMDTDTRDYFLDLVLSESDRMTRIVQDLLALSRLDTGRTNWQIETFDLRASVRRLFEVMQTDIEARGHAVELDLAEDLPSITADRQRMEQVILNILSNAIKYTPDGGTIRVKAEQKNAKSVLLQVSDTGVGIPEEDMEHLFERFYRVDKSRNLDTGGTGLGLAISKELVEAHGGKISIDSRLNEGTTVCIELPISCMLKTAEK